MPIKWSNLLSSHPETQKKSEYHKKNQLFGAFKSIKKNIQRQNEMEKERKKNTAKLPKTAIKGINENDLWIARFVVFIWFRFGFVLTIKINDCASPSPAPKSLCHSFLFYDISLSCYSIWFMFIHIARSFSSTNMIFDCCWSKENKFKYQKIARRRSWMNGS